MLCALLAAAAGCRARAKGAAIELATTGRLLVDPNSWVAALLDPRRHRFAVAGDGAADSVTAHVRPSPYDIDAKSARSRPAGQSHRR